MRQKYSTRAIVLSRSPLAEESLSVSFLTEDFGVVRARSQGARKKGSKMSAGIQTLSESTITLLRGKEGWRMAGAVLEVNWARELTEDARRRAARVLDLTERFVRGEHADAELFTLMAHFLAALAHHTGEEQDGVEMLAVVRMLRLLGLDAGPMYGDSHEFTPKIIADALRDRSALTARVNRGITASGL